MADDIRINLPSEIRIRPPQRERVTSEATPEARPGEAAKSFRQTLQEQIERAAPDVRFSAHAQSRLAARQIVLSDSDLARIQDAIDRAAGKGARDSLLVMDDLALVVSVTNRTVITAVDGPSRKGNVFTNIDSAVIV